MLWAGESLVLWRCWWEIT